MTKSGNGRRDESAKVVRIGGGSGFLWDSQLAAPQLLAESELDYLIFDCLAEGAMPYLGLKDEAESGTGYGRELLDHIIGPCFAEILRRKIRIVTNAGGLNPDGLADLFRERARELGFAPRIGVMTGDDVRDRADGFRYDGVSDMFDGGAYPDDVLTANAYLGAFPIAQLLGAGADIVITGRVVDSALALGPLIHEFGWRSDQFDLLAAGTTAGHLIECGAQVTGGVFTDWQLVPDWENIGYPICEVRSDGSLVITKPQRSGGLVSTATVAEQLLYEVADPQAYKVPDVTCDFSQVRLEQLAPDRVGVRNVRGHAPTASYKVCVTYRAGWRAVVYQPLIGIDAPAKAERQAEALFARGRMLLRSRNLPDFTDTHYVPIGQEHSYGAHGYAASRELVLKLVADHPDPEALQLFVREHVMAACSMAQGTSLTLSQAITPRLGIFSHLLDKRLMRPSIALDGEVIAAEGSIVGDFDPTRLAPPPPPTAQETGIEGFETVPLIALAWARSGEKGNLFNVAVIARDPSYMAHIAAVLTVESVADWFAPLFPKDKGHARRVDRYHVPTLPALNFVLHDSMEGGLLASPRLDPAAKSMAQQLLEFPVPVPSELANAVRKADSQKV